MDKASDIHQELKDRLASPLFFSFLISWCIINWKIIIGLIFYKNSELKMDGYISYIDFITQNLKASHTLFYPLFAAILYTFIYPIVRNCIYAFQAWTRNWGDNWNLRVSRTGNISIYKYLTLRDTYLQRTVLLEKVLKDESESLNQNEQLRNELLSMTDSNNSLKNELNKWQAANDANVLNGEWEYSELSTLSDEKIFSKINISGYNLQFYDKPQKRAEVVNFYSNPNSSRMYFALKSMHNVKTKSETASYDHYSLEWFDENKRLKGRLNHSNEVEFKRVS